MAPHPPRLHTIGNFLNDWWFYAVERRRELIEMPLAPAPTTEMHRWAAFCAAMVELLCWQENLPFPEWTDQESYILPEPWFLYEGWKWRAYLLATTPAPFKMRRIFGGDRMFLHVPSRGPREGLVFSFLSIDTCFVFWDL